MPKSRLVLGTVQLGMPYGIANTASVPSKVEVFAILDAAYEGGINTFDTASAYGGAEEVLGQWIVSRNLSEMVHVISKISSYDEIGKSCQKLHINKLDGCLAHAADEMHSTEIAGALRAAKDAGLVSHIGVSVYTVQQALEALQAGFEYIQVPYNVFDRRLDECGFFEKKGNGTVFARSPFLQGLLLMEPKAVPAHLRAAVPYLEKFRALVKSHGTSPLHAALGYVLQHTDIDHVVFGVDSLHQLREILAIRNMSKKLIEELHREFKHIDESILNPSLWRK